MAVHCHALEKKKKSGPLYACKAPAGAQGDSGVTAAALNTVPGRTAAAVRPPAPSLPHTSAPPSTHLFCVSPTDLVSPLPHSPPLYLTGMRCSTQLLLSRDAARTRVARSYALKHHSSLPAVCPFLSSHLITLLCQFPPHAFISLSCNLTPPSPPPPHPPSPLFSPSI